MQASLASQLVQVDSLEVSVLVDNVTDSLSTVPKDVANEVSVLMKNGTLKQSAGDTAAARTTACLSSSPLVRAAAGRR